MYKLGSRSLERLEGVHPDLVAVVKLAIQKTEIDFTVLEGLRTKERQVQLVASGASRTIHSRHLTGHAVDLGAVINGNIEWAWPLYHKIAKAMKEASGLKSQRASSLNIAAYAVAQNLPLRILKRLMVSTANALSAVSIMINKQYLGI